MERIVNVFYTVNTFIVNILMYLYFKKKVSTKYTIFPAYILLILRQIIRVADFEKSYEFLGPQVTFKKNLYQIYVFIPMMSYYHFLFGNIKGSIIILILMVYLSLSIIFYSQGFLKKFSDFMETIIITVYFMFGMFTINIIRQGNERKFEQNQIVNNRFKKIMDQSVEGIIIMNDKSIEYIND